MRLQQFVFSVKITAQRSSAVVRIRGSVPIGVCCLKYVCSWISVGHFG